MLNSKEPSTLIEQYSIHAHLQLNDVKTEDGLSLDFKNHMFMFDVYSDMASLERDIVGLKAAQVTFTTTATNAVLWLAKYKKIDIIYTLPTFDDIRVFSGGKVNRIIAQNEIYQSWVPNKDTMEQKVVGDNVIHFRGTHQAKAATMVSSALNVHDELDSSNQVVVEQYSTRLQHSLLKRTWWFSHPSVPDNGVDKKWQLSDQKHWMIQCASCKHWQYLMWPDSFDLEAKKYVCKVCRAEISDNVRRRGKWVAKKGREKAAVSGYWIPLWLMPQVTAAEVIKYYETKPGDYFWNKVVGLPYVGGGNKVTQRQIYQNLTNVDPKKRQRVVIGVDTGVDCRFVIGSSEGIYRYGQCTLNAEQELTDLLKYYERSLMFIDQGGDILMARNLRKAFPGRVFLCHYQKDRKTMQLVRWGDNDEFGNLLIDRDRMIQYVVDLFSEKKIPLFYQETKDEWFDYWLHWSHIYRVGTENPQTARMEYKWLKSDRDDWAHATVYMMTGVLRFGKGSIIKGSGLTKPEPNSYLVTPDMRTSINPLRKVIDETLDRVVVPKGEDGDWRDA